MNSKLNKLSLLKCGHFYCYVCLANYLKASIVAHKLPLTCVHEGCSKLVSIEELVNIFGIKMMEQFFEFARNNNNQNNQNNNQKNVEKNAGRKMRCPNSKCGRLITKDDELRSSQGTICEGCSQRVTRFSACYCSLEGQWEGPTPPCSNCEAARRLAFSQSFYAPSFYQQGYYMRQPFVSSAGFSKYNNNNNYYNQTFNSLSPSNYSSSFSSTYKSPLSYSYPPISPPSQNHFSYFSTSLSSTLFGTKTPSPSAASSFAPSSPPSYSRNSSLSVSSDIWKPFPYSSDYSVGQIHNSKTPQYANPRFSSFGNSDTFTSPIKPLPFRTQENVAIPFHY